MKIGEKKSQKIQIVNMSEQKTQIIGYLLLKSYMKSQNWGFSLWSEDGKYQLPTYIRGLSLPPKDTFSILVKCEPQKDGFFKDSITVCDTCTCDDRFFAGMSAWVGSPVIDVTDCDFPVTKINKWSYSSFNVQNKGYVSLEIYGYNGPTITGIKSKNKIYVSNELSDLDFSESNPLRIMPGQTLTFNISFSPDEAKDYPDSIVFISNTANSPHYNNGNPVDNVCVLSGKGILTGLLVNNYDWGRKRIHRPATFPVEPYPTIPEGEQDSAIRLTNNGYYPESVTRLTNLEEGGDISSFKMNRADLITTVSGGKSKVIPVYFQPEVPGEHLLKLMFSTLDAVETDAVSTLQGIGTVPKLQTQDYDFGCTQLNDFDNYVINNIIIRNLSLDEWEYGDSVTIFDLVGENISENINAWDSETSFRYDKNFITFPLVLQPGQSITFDVEFVATKSGKNEATLTTKSDAEFEVTSNLIGYDTETNVEDLQSNEIRIYPNPTSEYIEIKLSESFELSESYQIKILDVLGNEKINYELLITNYELVVDVADLPEGIYVIQLILQNKIITNKFCVVR
ncbi:MAG: T9SS type A sorting domain-containing protein, partial [bacterium]